MWHDSSTRGTRYLVTAANIIYSQQNNTNARKETGLQNVQSVPVWE
jgi:hypothetical protein